MELIFADATKIQIQSAQETGGTRMKILDLKDSHRYNLQFDVDGQFVKRTDNNLPVAKCKNLFKAKFNFIGDEWTGTKTALFAQGEYSKSVVLDDNDECVIPWEFFDTDENMTIGKVSVSCGDLVTTNCATVKITKSGYQESDASVPPSPDVYQQLVELAEDTKEIAQSVREDADAGEFDGEEGYSPKVSLTEELDGVTVTVQNKDGQQSAKVKNGKDGKPGKNGDPGADGITPHIGENGNWHIGDTDTGKPSRGLRGENATDKQVRTAVDAYMEENPVAITVDPTLAQEGQAADAKATGDKILQFTIKNTASGESIVLTDGAEEKLLDFGMQGKTEQLTTEGKNLFDIDEFLKLPLEQFSNYGNARVLIITLKPNTAYTMHTDNTGSLTGEVDVSRSLYFTSVDDMMLDGNTTGVFKGHNITKTSDETGKLKIVLIDRKNAIPIVNKEKYVMLAEGSTALPYEPYTGGKPSPSVEYPQEIVSAGKYDEVSGKYVIDVSVTGKNLVPPELDFVPFGNNDPKTIEFDPKTNSYKLITRPDNFNQVTCYVKFNLKKGIYTITRKIKIDGVDITNPQGLQIMDADTKKLLYSMHGGMNRKFELKKDTNVLINLGHFTEKTQKEAILCEVQLEKSDASTPYEPYHEPQTLQLQLEKPLTKWDRIEKRDGVWGVVHKSKEVVFNGSEDEVWRNQTDSSGNTQFYTDLKDCPIKHVSDFVDNFYCDKFTKSSKASGDIAIGEVRYGSFGAAFAPVFKPKHEVGTLLLWRDLLKENPITILYETNSEEFVPLPQETQTALNALHTYYPTTVMSNSEDCEMEVTYVCDTKNYIDNKISENVASVISQYRTNVANLLSLMPLETQATMIANDTNNILEDMEEMKHE